MKRSMSVVKVKKTVNNKGYDPKYDDPSKPYVVIDFPYVKMKDTGKMAEILTKERFIEEMMKYQRKRQMLKELESDYDSME